MPKLPPRETPKQRAHRMSMSELRKAADELSPVKRGAGRSHRAIELLPRRAVFVTYCQSDHHYELTRKLGRHDIVLVPHDIFPEFVHRNRVVRKFSTIFFDHAVQEHCGPLEFEQLEYWLDLAKPYLTGRYPDDEV